MIPNTQSTTRAALTALSAAVAIGSVASPAAGAPRDGAPGTHSLEQKLIVSWREDRWTDHARARFAIPGVGAGEVLCRPNATWIRMLPADPSAENSMWIVKSQIKDGVAQTAVKDVRVYRFSTPTSTVPRGSGPTGYEGFNQHTPLEPADRGSMVGLISKRGARNVPGGPGVAPTSFRLGWSWSGFGTRAARCTIRATFITAISGRSRSVSEGRARDLPNSPSSVFSFNLNWHGEDELPAAERRSHSLTVPGIGRIVATCQDGIGSPSYLTVIPAPGASPFADVIAYQGEGIHNSVQTEYHVDPVSGRLGPVALPVNGMLVATLRPDWYAPPESSAQLIVSSLRKTNDPAPAGNYCEISAQAVGARAVGTP